MLKNFRVIRLEEIDFPVQSQSQCSEDAMSQGLHFLAELLDGGPQFGVRRVWEWAPGG